MPHLELIPWCFVDSYFGPGISVAHAKNHKQVNKVEKGIVLLSPHTKKIANRSNRVPHQKIRQRVSVMQHIIDKSANKYIWFTLPILFIKLIHLSHFLSNLMPFI
jgi:hypothetical protein